MPHGILLVAVPVGVGAAAWFGWPWLSALFQRDTPVIDDPPIDEEKKTPIPDPDPTDPDGLLVCKVTGQPAPTISPSAAVALLVVAGIQAAKVVPVGDGPATQWLLGKNGKLAVKMFQSAAYDQGLQPLAGFLKKANAVTGAMNSCTLLTLVQIPMYASTGKWTPP